MNIPPEKGSIGYLNELYRRRAEAQKVLYETQQEIDQFNSQGENTWGQTKTYRQTVWPMPWDERSGYRANFGNQIQPAT